MDRAEGALLVAEKALSEAKRANSTLGSVATVQHIDDISSNLLRLETLIESLSSHVELNKSSIAETLNELKAHISELDEVDLDLSNITTSRLDHISNELEKFSSRISDLEIRPIPRDGIDGKDAEINIEELRSIYVEDIEARLKDVYKAELIDAHFENVYNEIRSKVDIVKSYLIERIESLPQPSDPELIVKNNLINVPTVSEVRQIFNDEFGKIKSTLSLTSDKNPQYIQIPQEEIPEDVAEKVAKAISIVAESPSVYTQQQPIVVNVTQPSSPPSSQKRIVLRRDKDGNTTADVTTVDSSKKITMSRDKDGNPVADIGDDK